jgi:hypothetical protein
VSSGGPFHLRFGILIHAARGEESFDMTAAYRDYLKIAAPNGPDALTEQ